MSQGLVDVFAGQADVGGSSKVPVWNFAPIAASGRNLAPVLRRVIFVGKAAFGGAFNRQRIGLRVIDRDDRSG